MVGLDRLRLSVAVLFQLLRRPVLLRLLRLLLRLLLLSSVSTGRVRGASRAARSLNIRETLRASPALRSPCGRAEDSAASRIPRRPSAKGTAASGRRARSLRRDRGGGGRSHRDRRSRGCALPTSR